LGYATSSFAGRILKIPRKEKRITANGFILVTLLTRSTPFRMQLGTSFLTPGLMADYTQALELVKKSFETGE